MTTALKVAFGSVAVMVIGSLGPWASAFFVSVNGIDTGDGKVTLISAVIAAAFLVRFYDAGSGWAAVITLLIGLLGSFLTIKNIIDISEAGRTRILGEDVRVASAEWGLWLAAVGSVALVISAFLLWQSGRATEVDGVDEEGPSGP